MARIAGVDLPREKRIEIGLTYIYGIGRVSANKILADAKVNPDTRVRDLTDEEVSRIRDVMDEHYTVEGDLVHVEVGEVEHPMFAEHWIEWISLKTDQGIQRKYLKPGEKPAIDFKLCDNETVEEVYAYCNLHGLWKA